MLPCSCESAGLEMTHKWCVLMCGPIESRMSPARGNFMFDVTRPIEFFSKRKNVSEQMHWFVPWTSGSLWRPPTPHSFNEQTNLEPGQSQSWSGMDWKPSAGIGRSIWPWQQQIVLLLDPKKPKVVPSSFRWLNQTKDDGFSETISGTCQSTNCHESLRNLRALETDHYPATLAIHLLLATTNRLLNPIGILKDKLEHITQRE